MRVDVNIPDVPPSDTSLMHRPLKGGLLSRRDLVTQQLVLLVHLLDGALLGPTPFYLLGLHILQTPAWSISQIIHNHI